LQTVYILSGKIGEMKNEKKKWFAGLAVCHAQVVGKRKCAHSRKRMFLVWAQWGMDFRGTFARN
jgi:hypothetical protein